jgi:hypothetical protein
METPGARLRTRAPYLPELIATVYEQSPAPLRSRLVSCLLGALGPLAMAALAKGSFARFLFREPTEAGFVTADDVVTISAMHVAELVRYVSEASPARFASLVEMLQQEDPTMIRTLAGATLVLLVNTWLRGRPAKEATQTND